MEHISFSELKVTTNDEGAVVREPTFKELSIGEAEIFIEHRYPKEGYVLNTACEVLACILEQRGRILPHPDSGEEPIVVSRGSRVRIPQGEAYAFEGPMRISYISSPAWSADQAEHIQ